MVALVALLGLLLLFWLWDAQSAWYYLFLRQVI